MSRRRNRCRAPKILNYGTEDTLHSRRKTKRNTVFNPYINEYVAKKTRKKKYLQTVLSSEPDRYDNVWFGDSIEDAPKKYLRFWFQNCNSLVKKGDVREFQMDIATMADSGINYFGFSETCVNHSKPGYSSKMCDAFNQIIPSGGFTMTNTKEYPPESNFQPGGVAAGFDDTLRMRYLSGGSDPMGRWVWHEFGQNERRLRVYTVYRVNDGSDYASGENTAWSQQKRSLLKNNITVNPRKHMLETLHKELKKHVESGVNIIVAGDFNEGLASPEGMSTVMENIGMVNVFEQRQETKMLPRTHSRGSKAIDHIWVTPFVMEHIMYAGVAPFGYHIDSDHRGLYIDLDDGMLFQPEDVRLIYHDFRRLKSQIPKRVKRYTKLVDSEWKIQKVDEKYLRLLEMCITDNDVEQIEKETNELDSIITKVLIRAETKCTRMASHHLDVWTPELMAAMKKKRHWRSKLTQAQKLPLKF